jgi:hypothetical protein
VLLEIAFCVLGFVDQMREPTEFDIPYLIQRMGNDDYRIRENATDKLAKLKNKASRDLQYAANNNPCPEIRNRAVRLLGQMYSFRWDKEIPYIYAVPRGDVKLNGRNYHFPLGTAKKHYRNHVETEIEWNEHAFREATLDFIRPLIRSDMPREDIAALLQLMTDTVGNYQYTDMEDGPEEEEGIIGALRRLFQG